MSISHSSSPKQVRDIVASCATRLLDGRRVSLITNIDKMGKVPFTGIGGWDRFDADPYQVARLTTRYGDTWFNNLSFIRMVGVLRILKLCQ